MINPSDIAIPVAQALVFFSTIGCIVYGLICWNRQESSTSMKKEQN